MAKEYAKKFYKSTAWRQVRTECIQRAGGLCEICLKTGDIVPGVIVHHKEHITPENISNPAVTLTLDNLEFVCISCHNLIHKDEEIKQGKNKKSNKNRSTQPRRYNVDDDGNVVIAPYVDF